MIKVVLTITIIVVIVYSYAIANYFNCLPQHLWNWLSSLIATFVSVLLAVIVGITLFNYSQDKTKINDRKTYLSLLQSELSDTNRILSDSGKMNININNNTYPVLVTYIQPIVLEDAARSGLFNEVISENLLHLARKMKMFNLMTNFLLNIIASGRASDPNLPNHISNAVQNVEGTRKGIIEGIEHMAKQLKINLSSSINVDKEGQGVSNMIKKNNEK